MRCSNCQGPWHPATGHAFSASTVACGPCAGRFWAWVVRHTNGKGARRSRKVPVARGFYESAATSIRA